MRRMRRTAERIHVERNSLKNYVNGAYFGYIGATVRVTMTITLSSHRSGICLLFVCCLSAVVCVRCIANFTLAATKEELCAFTHRSSGKVHFSTIGFVASWCTTTSFC